MNLGKIIYTKRKEKGLSQEQLANQINVARQTICKWKLNETIPGVNSLKDLAITLEFSIDEALEIEIPGKNDDSIEWWLIGGFIIGNSLGFFFNNYLLGCVLAITGLIFGLIFQHLKKWRST